MRIGAICRMDLTGLGIQSKEFFDHIPCKALVINSSNFKNGLAQYPQWYPGQKIVTPEKGLKIPPDVIKDFIKDIDVLITFETAYDYSIFEICRSKGVKTILQLNYEFLEYPSKLHPPDLFAAPSLWHYNDIPEPKIHLPVPVNAKHFHVKRRPYRFVHITGQPAAHDRNGTYSFLNCLRYVKNSIEVTIYCQNTFPLPRYPSYISVTKDFSYKQNYYDNFDGGVLVMPRKYGGLSLVVNEAIAAGMPVIMTDISPNNYWLPKEWLVFSQPSGSFQCKKHIDINEVDLQKLAEKIDQFCGDQFYDAAIKKALKIKSEISWEALLPQYKKVLGIS